MSERIGTRIGTYLDGKGRVGRGAGTRHDEGCGERVDFV